MDEDQMTTSNPMDRLGHKIDALTKIVNAGFSGVETRFAGVDRRLVDVETRLGGVETRMDHVETGLTDVKQGLAKVQVLAKRTDEFTKNAWDSLTSLTRNVDEGFKEAKKDREERFDLVHKAIRHWGGRVDTLETAPPRATKRRR